MTAALDEALRVVPAFGDERTAYAMSGANPVDVWYARRFIVRYESADGVALVGDNGESIGVAQFHDVNATSYQPLDWQSSHDWRMNPGASLQASSTMLWRMVDAHPWTAVALAVPYAQCVPVRGWWRAGRPDYAGTWLPHEVAAMKEVGGWHESAVWMQAAAKLGLAFAVRRQSRLLCVALLIASAFDVSRALVGRLLWRPKDAS